MSVSLQASGSEDVRVTAGEKLVLRVRAFDPAGILGRGTMFEEQLLTTVLT